MNLRSMWAAFAASAVAALAAGDIESNDPQADAEFGSTITISGFTYAIGAPGHSGGGRVEVRSVVQGEHVVLGNPNLWNHADDEFGSSVALSDSLCVVGAPGFDEPSTNTGGAWVYERSIAGWNLYQSLNRNDENSSDEFGSAVAISANRIFVGAPRAEWNGSDRGMVAVYEKEYGAHSWTLRRELFAGSVGDTNLGYGEFGAAIATNGRFLAVGAPGINDGVCFLYRIPGMDTLPLPNDSDWRPEVVWAPDDGGFSPEFGASMAISDDLLVVGAPDWNGWPNTGAVFIYRYLDGVWSLDGMLQSEEGVAYGSSVAIEDGMIVVGDPEAGDGGRVYLYAGAGGSWFEQTHTITDGALGDSLGHAVAIKSGVLYAGAPGHGGGIVRTGDVLSCLDCNNNSTCDEDEIASDPTLDCNSDGVLDVCQELLDCNGNGVPDMCEDSAMSPRCFPENGPAPVEILVLEDTSGSTDQERKIVCGMIDAAVMELDSYVGLQVTAQWTRIASSSGGVGCLSGDEFPIPQGSATPACSPWGARFVEDTEDWGDAISHAIAAFPWSDDGLRFIIILTDEGPSHGESGGNCGTDDIASLGLATQLATLYGVQLFPAPLPGTEGCLFNGVGGLMAALAEDSFASVLDARDLIEIDPADIVEQLASAIDASPYVQDCESCAGDVDGDGMVDANDLLQVISDWGMTESPADLNEDGLVDASDLLEVIAGWGPCG